MIRIARFLLFSTLLLSPVGSTLVAASDEPLGVLVVVHGSTTAWNAAVEASVATIQQHTPSQVAYLMGANNRTPQEAYDDLVAAGVQRVVIVPLLVSSYSSHYEQIRFIGHLRDDYPGSDWMSLTPLHGPADVVGVTPALDAHPILADILSDRARALSRDPSQESLVIVAHGPNGDADADRWIGVIRELGAQIRSRVPFGEIDIRLLRDDAPKPVKDQALAEFRDSVASRASGRVVVVPLMLGPGRVVDQIPNVLTGLDYRWDGRPVLPDGRIADWITSQVARVSAPQSAASQRSPDQRGGVPPDAVPAPQTAQSTDDPLTFLESVTVTATLRPTPVRETPGTVTVIDSDVIQGRQFETFADLVKYEPGVYVENNVTRLNLNGFNIRGIGGNRVMTQVDGVQTSEQFDFGPLSVHQVGLDLDALKSVEIVRSANSALYGSDALGGVVSLFTKDPMDYLGGRNFHVGAKMTWDGRANNASGNLSLAGGGERLQGSLFVSANRGGEIRNRGTIEATDDTRTAPNPQDVVGTQVLAKLVFTASPGNVWRAAAELHDTRVETEWYSDRALVDFGFLSFVTVDADAMDTQDRRRFSLDHTLVGRGLDQVSWRVYGQFNDTSQVSDRERLTFAFGPPSRSHRHGTIDFEQVGYGGSAQGQHWLGGLEDGVRLTFGASYKTDGFDMLRDRSEINTRSGEPVRTSLIFPSKYFPESEVVEAGSYFQAELQFDRLTLLPGVRYDHLSLDADQTDPVFIASLNPEAADFSDGAVSPKVGAAVRVTDVVTAHAQYARGFRAPPFHDINAGFTNPAGGYTSLPNATLRAETSDNLEVGIRTAFDRASLEVTGFSNRYDNFINFTTLGFNPLTRLLEFQAQNLEQAEINGVELRGEAYLTDSVMIRASYARIEGVEILRDIAVLALAEETPLGSIVPNEGVLGIRVPALAEETPLGSIAPNEGVLGIRYVQPAGCWGAELSLRLVESYQGAPDEDQFAPEAYQVVDLVGHVSLVEDLTLRLGALNLTDAKYFEWWNVRGRQANDPVIDRYSSPGISIITSLGYDW